MVLLMWFFDESLPDDWLNFPHFGILYGLSSFIIIDQLVVYILFHLILL